MPDDFVVHRELADLHGLDEFNDYLQGRYDPFPDLTITIDTVIAEDEMVAVQSTGTGTYGCAYNGVEPTGKEVTIPGCGSLESKPGKSPKRGARRAISACSPSSASSNAQLSHDPRRHISTRRTRIRCLRDTIAVCSTVPAEFHRP